MLLKKASELPVRGGVGASCVSLPVGQWKTVLEFLIERFPAVVHATWIARILAHEVLDQFGRPINLSTSYVPNVRIFYYRAVEKEEPIPFTERIVYRDEFIVVADKPHFLPVTPSGPYVQETLLTRLRRSLALDRLTPVHRIDRDTAGLVLFSIDPATRDLYHALFRDHGIRKIYEAIARSESERSFPFHYRSRVATSRSFMQMQEVPGEPNAETIIEQQEMHGVLARYLLRPLTGRKHQLRLHMAINGMPILNDRIYPVMVPMRSSLLPAEYDHPLQLLAKSMEFIDPVTGQHHYFESDRVLQVQSLAM